jgi:pentatricopeptide repeat protein
MDLERAYTVYQRAKLLNLSLSLHLMSSLLSLACGLGEVGSGNSIPRLISPPKDMIKALEIFSDMKIQDLPLNEASYSSMIRCACDHFLYSKALELFDEMKAHNVSPKLRTITSLLQVFSCQKLLIDEETRREFIGFEVCHSLFEECLKQFPLIIFTEKEYYYLLRISFYTNQSKVFLEYLSLLMEELLVLNNEETMEIIKEFFSSPLSLSAVAFSSTSSSSSVSTASSFQIEESLVSKEGIVEVNQQQLLSIDLKEDIKQDLLAKITKFAITPRDPLTKPKLNNKIKDSILYQSTTATTASKALKAVASVEENGIQSTDPSCQLPSSSSDTPSSSSTINSSSSTHNKPKKEPKNNIPRIDTNNPDFRKETWKFFEEKLYQISIFCQETKKTFIILDGANIGYYKQNYPGAPLHLNYSQIQFIIEELLHLNYFPFVILHSRHLTPQLPSKSVEYQEIQRLLGEWKEKNYLYTSPKGFNDDWFWMYATIKYHCYIITNDDMRDHHFQLLSPR